MSKEKRIMIRTTKDFHAKLAEQAKEEKRSLNKQLLTILETYFDPGALRARLSELERQQ
jgi:predicted HicB family RNase H-like nuclease